MEIEFFWLGKRIGSSTFAPQLLEMGPVVVVKVPHAMPSDQVLKRSFVARAVDGREFSIDVVRVKPDTDVRLAGASSTVSGYLRTITPTA